MSFAGVMKRDVKTRGYEMSSDIKLFLPLDPENNLSLLPTVESKDKNLKLNFLFFFCVCNYISAWLKMDVRRVESCWKRMERNEESFFIVLFLGLKCKWNITWAKETRTLPTFVCWVKQTFTPTQWADEITF